MLSFILLIAYDLRKYAMWYKIYQIDDIVKDISLDDMSLIPTQKQICTYIIWLKYISSRYVVVLLTFTKTDDNSWSCYKSNTYKYGNYRKRQAYYPNWTFFLFRNCKP